MSRRRFAVETLVLTRCTLPRKLRLEKELKASSTEADTLKTKLESLDLSFDEFRSSARAEEER